MYTYICAKAFFVGGGGGGGGGAFMYICPPSGGCATTPLVRLSDDAASENEGNVDLRVLYILDRYGLWSQ